MRCTPSRYCFLVLVAGFVVLAPCSFAGFNRWTTSGPGTGLVSQIVTDSTNPAIAYALPEYGVFKTTNGGASWQPANQGLPAGTRITKLAICPDAPNTLYAATDSAVFRSSDGGGHWQLQGFVDGVLLLAADSTTLYAGFKDGVFIKLGVSTDGGKTWTQPAEFQYLNSLAVSADGKAYAVAIPGLFTSSDHGQTWTEVASAPAFPENVYVDPATGTIDVLVFQTVYFSSDGGRSWTASPSVNRHVNAIAPAGASHVYAATEDGVFEYAGGSSTWTAVGQALTGKWVVTVAATTSATPGLYAATDRGGIVIATGKSDWTPADTGLPGAVAYDVAVAPTTRGIAYTASEAGLFRTDDGGETWRHVQTAASLVTVSPSNANTVYASSDTVQKTTDGGESWTSIKVDSASVFAVASSNPETLYAALYDYGMSKSTDAGTSWSTIMNGLPTDYFYSYADAGWSADSIAVDPTNAANVYVGKPQGIFYTSNGGSTWSAIAPFANVPALVIDKGSTPTVYAGTTGVVESRVGNPNWSSAGLIDKTVTALAVTWSSAPILFAGTADGHVYRTTDRGAYWTVLDDGLDGLPIRKLSVDPTGQFVFAATTAGVYQIEIVGDDTTPIDVLADDPARLPRLIEQLHGDSNGNAFVLPVAGKVTGIAGNLFVTEVTLTNHRDVAQNVIVIWLPQAYADIGRSFRLTLPASSEGPVDIADIAQRLGTAGLGSLAVFAVDANGNVDASASIDGSARISVHPGDRRAPREQIVPAAAVFSDHDRGTANNLEQDAAYRTNLGIVNLSSDFRQFTIAIHGATGSGQVTLGVPPFSLVQIPVGGDYGLFDAVVSSDKTARWLFYASTINNATLEARTTLGVSQ